MPDAALRIEDGSGSVRDELDAESITYTRALDEEASGEATVFRQDWVDVEDAIDERNDELYLVADGTDEFAGRFSDAETEGSRVRVRIASPEEDAADAEPTGGNETYQNTADSTIVTEQVIDGVDSLSAGTIDTVNASVSYSASHASRSKVLYDLREATGAEFRFNADWTLDYVDSLGSDKTGSVTLSPSNANVVGKTFKKLRDVRENTTHVRGLGAQDGPEQVTAEAVVSHYQSGERPVWRRYANKEVIDQSRMQSIVDTIVSEIESSPRYLTVECSVKDEDLELGDEVHVTYPEENIDTDLRITMLTTEITRRGYLLLCTLSNRALATTDRQTKRNDDLERFNQGYQGFVDRDNFRAVEKQAFDGTVDATGEYFYPNDVVSEQRAEIVVKTEPYRVDSKGAAGGGDHTHSVTVSHPSHDHSVTIPDHNHSVTIPDHNHGVTVEVADHAHSLPEETGDTGETDGHRHTYVRRGGFNTTRSQVETGGVVNATAQSYSTTSDDGGGTTETTDDGGGTTQTSTDALGTTTSETSDASGTHTHDPDPGIIESFPNHPESNANGELLPSGVDLLIDGTTVATDIGSGEFTTTIEVTGEFTSGVNDISLQSDSLGLVTAIVRTELFRRGQTT